MAVELKRHASASATEHQPIPPKGNAGVPIATLAPPRGKPPLSHYERLRVTQAQHTKKRHELVTTRNRPRTTEPRAAHDGTRSR